MLRRSFGGGIVTIGGERDQSTVIVQVAEAKGRRSRAMKAARLFYSTNRRRPTLQRRGRLSRAEGEKKNRKLDFINPRSAFLPITRQADCSHRILGARSDCRGRLVRNVQRSNRRPMSPYQTETLVGLSGFQINLSGNAYSFDRLGQGALAQTAPASGRRERMDQ